MKKVITTILFFFMLLTSSCSYQESKEENKQTVTQREYLYLDIHHCIHLDSRCLHLTGVTENKTEPMYSVKFVKATELYTEEIRGYCARCISTTDYEWIQKVIDSSWEQY